MNKQETFKLMNEFEKYSYGRISQVSDWHINNADIRWHSNCISEFKDDNITEFYLNDSYSRETRWDLWNHVVDWFLKNNIKTNLDIGSANNHFSFLCNKKNIFSVGIDPRENCVKQCQNIFEENFGNNSYGYIGNIKTFVDFFEKCDTNIFDCITILNFLHGNDHDPSEIKKLFKVLPKITNHIIITEPKWEELGLSKITDNYSVVDIIKNSVLSHIVYKLN